MKKRLSKTLLTLFIISIVLGLFCDSVSINAETKHTLSYYEELVEKYKKDAQNNKNAINKTEDEIQETKNNIEKLKSETLALTDEIKELNSEIEEYEGVIKEKLTQSKQVLEYMQLSNDRNVYLDYIFKADSVTDLINRSYVIQEIVNYNNDTISDLEQIISDNEKRQDEIDKRQDEIKVKESELEKKVSELGEKKVSLSSGGVDIDKQLKIYEEIVAQYRKVGCKSSDVIGVDCAKEEGVVAFRRPTTVGYITQEAYYGYSYTHRAIDIGSPNRTREKIYPIADGTITSKYTDSYGALCLAILHYNLLDGKYYTSLYVHMSSYAPNLYVGKKVSSNDYIGYMGMTGKATGPHLHIEIFPCKLYNPADPNCSSWSKWDAFAKNQLKNGYNPRQLINFPKGTWYSR